MCVSAVHVKKAPASTQAKRQPDSAAESTKRKRLEINLPLDTFTLHETVKDLLRNKDAENVFTLHAAVKRLVDGKKTKAGVGWKQAESARNVKDSGVPTTSSVGDDHQLYASTHANTISDVSVSVSCCLHVCRNDSQTGVHLNGMPFSVVHVLCVFRVVRNVMSPISPSYRVPVVTLLRFE